MIFIDTFEPTELEYFIKPAVPTMRASLNTTGFADYMFIDILGRRVQFERKQWGEILSNPERVEEQLRREFIGGVEELNLIVEGHCEPTAKGVDVYKKTGKPYLRKVYSYKQSFTRIVSWLWQLDKTGISVYQTPNTLGTAHFLCAAFKNSQKTEHTTLQRYIKPKIRVGPQDSQVLTLMGIEGAGLGEQRAMDLVLNFGSVWNVLNASMSELTSVEGIGPGIVYKLWKAVGKE